jgi:Glycosyltransferase
MKVTVVNAMAPFIWGGAEELAHHLILNLRRRGHDADLYRIPFAWEPFTGIPTEMARLKALRLPAADRVITMKFPVYLLDAENHSTWLVHQYRQAYDLWHTPFTNIPNTDEGLNIRAQIIAHDTATLGHRDSLFTISAEVSARLKIHNNVIAPPLRAPLNDPAFFVGGDYGDYILAPGRVGASKRQSLLIEAMRHLSRSAKLIVAGPPESEQDRDLLTRLVEDAGLADRVHLDLQFLSRQKLADYVNNCRAVAYLPFQEDSYGYVTMEAFEARKPVITVTDAGELLEIVIEGQTGRVVSPNSQDLADAMKGYLESADRARAHGEAGRELFQSKHINWNENISRLLA